MYLWSFEKYISSLTSICCKNHSFVHKHLLSAYYVSGIVLARCYHGGLKPLLYELLKRENRFKRLQNSLANRERYQHRITLLYYSIIILVTIGIITRDFDDFDTFHVSMGAEGKIKKPSEMTH